ncbi:hypothetical protein ACNFZ6_05045 [Enterobacter hormaechei]|uniref:hypothetical protein n=1 Tax=Enterobacter hormaechei TaxID=158836 RepID=UPI003CF56C13
MNLQNRESIGQLISVLHRRHSEIVRAISVYDEHNRLFVTSNFHLDPTSLKIPEGTPFPASSHGPAARRYHDPAHADYLRKLFTRRIRPSPMRRSSNNMLGYVALELDLKSVRLQQYKEIFISGVMMLFCIGIALIFGWRLMRDVTGPIRNMVNTVDRIRRGSAGQPRGKASCSASWIC